MHFSINKLLQVRQHAHVTSICLRNLRTKLQSILDNIHNFTERHNVSATYLDTADVSHEQVGHFEVSETHRHSHVLYYQSSIVLMYGKLSVN